MEKTIVKIIIEILAIILSVAGIAIYVSIKIKKHNHKGDNIAQNGSVAADNINAPVTIVNKNNCGDKK